MGGISCITITIEEFKRGSDVTVMLDKERADQRLNCDCAVYNHQNLLVALTVNVKRRCWTGGNIGTNQRRWHQGTGTGLKGQVAAST